jgi:hypothetical protein
LPSVLFSKYAKKSESPGEKDLPYLTSTIKVLRNAIYEKVAMRLGGKKVTNFKGYGRS